MRPCLRRFLCKCRERLRIIRMPARQRWTVLDDVACGPQDTPLIERSRYVVIGTEDVEIAGFDARDHEIDSLHRCPGALRFFDAAMRGERREYKAGDEQVRADLATGGLAQLVLQRLGESLHPRFRDIIGRIAGW